MNKKLLSTLSLISVLGVSSFVYADNYVFRQPSPGVKAFSGGGAEIVDDQDESLPENIACFDPANVGKIGTEGICEDMLIVDYDMLRAVSGGGDNTFAIAHPESGRIFTFGDSDDNVFTGQVTTLNSIFQTTDFNDDIGYWDTRNVNSLMSTFLGAQSFNQDISAWDVSNVSMMFNTFYGASSFNQPLNSWDVSNTHSLNGIFFGATSFNQPLNLWDVSSVTDLGFAFRDAISFNQPLDNWDVSNVNSLSSTFFNALSFNQDINNWDVSNASSMPDLFRQARNFNQPLDQWDVSGVVYMGYPFMDAESFNQDISNWCTTSYTGEDLPSGDLSNPTELDELVAGSGIASQPDKQPQWGSCP